MMRLSNADPEDADFFAVQLGANFLPDTAEITLGVGRAGTVPFTVTMPGFDCGVIARGGAPAANWPTSAVAFMTYRGNFSSATSFTGTQGRHWICASRPSTNVASSVTSVRAKTSKTVS